ncbi:hypothetical protein B0H13DRAFT_2307981 [Mycena leptocephala]|nr:hypothetical protein B0H13DRAFT_2307981 [Mycena leptocephala]
MPSVNPTSTIAAAARNAIQEISMDPYTLPIRLLLSGPTIDAVKLTHLGRSRIEAHLGLKLFQISEPYNLNVPLDVLMDTLSESLITDLEAASPAHNPPGQLKCFCTTAGALSSDPDPKRLTSWLDFYLVNVFSAIEDTAQRLSTPPNVQEDGAGLDPEVVLLEHFENRHHVGL